MNGRAAGDVPGLLFWRMAGGVLLTAGLAFADLWDDYGPSPRWIGFAGYAVAAVGSGVLAWSTMALDAADRRNWHRFCRKHGFGYLFRDTKGRPKQWRGAAPFDHGHRAAAMHVVAGTEGGMPFEMWNYRYTRKRGRHVETVDWQVVVVPMPIDSPGLRMEREYLGHKALEALAPMDIDFESDVFSRQVHVTCPDRRWAYEVIHPRMIEFLLRVGTDATWIWRGKTLLLARPGRPNPATALAFLRLTDEFIAQVPRTLRRSSPTTHEADARGLRPRRPAETVTRIERRPTGTRP